MVLWRSSVNNLLRRIMWCVQLYHAWCALGFIGTGVKGSNKLNDIFKLSHLVINIYLCCFKYCLMYLKTVHWQGTVVVVPSYLYIHMLLSWVIFTHVPLTPCPLWSMFTPAFGGQRWGLFLCDRFCMFGSILGEI